MDSNLRGELPLLVFKTSALDRSANAPELQVMVGFDGQIIYPLVNRPEDFASRRLKHHANGANRSGA